MVGGSNVIVTDEIAFNGVVKCYELDSAIEIAPRKALTRSIGSSMCEKQCHTTAGCIDDCKL